MNKSGIYSMDVSGNRTTMYEIEIDGIQPTNTGPIGNGDGELFENGVVGGPVSKEFRDAQRFKQALTG